MTGFERWLSRNPGGSKEDYLVVLAAFSVNKRIVPPPKFVALPGGAMAPISGVHANEVAELTAEFVKSAQNQQ